MLSVLLAHLDSRGYAPSTRVRYARSLTRFAAWCAEHGASAWPVPMPLLRRYLTSLKDGDQRAVAALDAVRVASGLKRLRDEGELREALVAAGLLHAPQREVVKLREASRLHAATRKVYTERIRAFRRWCSKQSCAPTWAAFDKYVDSRELAAGTKRQYRAAVSHWVQMPPRGASNSPAPSSITQPVHGSTPPVAQQSTRRRQKPLVLRTSEQRLLYQLGRTGIAEHHRHARGFAKVSEARLRLLVRRGYLQVDHGLVKVGGEPCPSPVRYYSLASRGRSWLRRHGVRNLYRWNPQQLNHDAHLTDVYYQLPPAVRRTWITESELIHQLQRQGQHVAGGAVDGAVFANGQAYAIEIAIGYKAADIAKKQAFIDRYFDGRGLLITS